MKLVATLVIAFVFVACDGDRTPLASPSLDMRTALPSSDPTGRIATVSTNGQIDRGNPFFRSLGTNGRSCASCHLQ